MKTRLASKWAIREQWEEERVDLIQFIMHDLEGKLYQLRGVTEYKLLFHTNEIRNLLQIGEEAEQALQEIEELENNIRVLAENDRDLS